LQMQYKEGNPEGDLPRSQFADADVSWISFNVSPTVFRLGRDRKHTISLTKILIAE
jgi:hypothetical protein